MNRMADFSTAWNKIVTVYSPGSGTGKSEIAASLGYILGKKGKKVWIIDANMFAPTLDIVFNIPIDDRKTLSEFILNERLSAIPLCDISHVLKSRSGGRLFFTPSMRNDVERRSRLEEVLIDSETVCEKIPKAIFNGMGNGIDYLIIDTHPGFERINQVWLGITKYLLIVSRITDADIGNLKVLLKDKDLLDIPRKLVIFNNVCLTEERDPRMTMKNRKMMNRFLSLLQNPPEFLGTPGGDGTDIEIFPRAIPYSKSLACHDGSTGLYIRSHTKSTFAFIMRALAEKIAHDLNEE